MNSWSRWIWSVPILLFFVYNLLHPAWGGISHFDEGQYAFARVWPWINQFDVDQAFFSPPLFPFLVGLFQQLPTSRPDMAGVAVSQLAYLASLLFAYRLAVAWWGRRSGPAALIVVVASSMRLSFGGVGLTDSLFSALLLATLWAATNAFRRGSTRWTFVTGLLAASCWSCKYNGFIALAIIGGFVLHLRTFSAFVRWTLISLIVFAVMAPWYWAIHTHHPDGVSALQRHQAGYVRGVGAIPSGVVTAVQLRSVSNDPVFGLLFAPIFAAVSLIGKRSSRVPALAAAMLVVGDAWASGYLVPIAGLICLPCAVAAARPIVRIPLMLAVLLTTFLPAIYTPYLRLWLPAEHLLALSCVGALTGITRRIPARRSIGWVACGAAGVALVTIAYFVAGPSPNRERFESEAMRNERRDVSPILRPLASRRPWGYKLAVENLVRMAKEQDVKRMLIYARPPLLFYLAMSDLRIPIIRLPDAPISADALTPGTMIVVDIADRQSRHFHDSFADDAFQRRISEVASLSVEPSIVTMLDDFGVLGPPSKDAYNIHVYVVGRSTEAAR